MGKQKVKSTIIGSYPKPGYLIGDLTGRELLDSDYSFMDKRRDELGEETFNTLLDKACAEVIADQNESDIDIITDGEQRRDHYIHYILKKLNGFDYQNMYEKVVKKSIKGNQKKTETQYVPRVISKIEYKYPFLIDDFNFLKSKTKKQVKIGLPGPTTVVDAVRNEYYKTDKELAFDYAKAVSKEVKALHQTGCEIIQFDDPGLLRNLERAKDWGIEALDMCFAGVNSATIIVHVCRSYPNKQLEKLGIVYKADESYYPYLLDLLQNSRVDQISIEGKQGNLNPAVFEHAGDKTIILGCLDVGDEKVESVNEIVEQGVEALAYLKPEQLVLGPDCGLLQISREAAKGKLTNLAKAVEVLNKKNN